MELDASRNVVSGSRSDLVDAIGRGADLRIGTEFIHNEHIDVDSPSNERVREVAEFGVTCRADPDWVAGIMSLRQPIELPTGFGPRPSMSFFLYNSDGTQGIARPYLDGEATAEIPGPSPPQAPMNMPRYHVIDQWDAETNAPSQNFVYDFERYRFHVDDSWQEVMRHTANGDVVSGSIDALVDAFSAGCTIKIGAGNLCADLADAASSSPAHEVFVQGGSAYYYTDQKLFILGTHPVVRVRPSVPMRYTSHGWDFGWLMARTDGHVVYRSCDPYRLSFSDKNLQLPIRWFVR